MQEKSKKLFSEIYKETAGSKHYDSPVTFLGEYWTVLDEKFLETSDPAESYFIEETRKFYEQRKLIEEEGYLEHFNVIYELMECVQRFLNRNQMVTYGHRIKCAESFFGKLIDQTEKDGEANPVRDHIGIRSITLNDDVDYLYDLSDAFFGIITGLNRKLRREFLEWLGESDDFNVKTSVISLLDNPIEFGFPGKPKTSGYDYEKNEAGIYIPKRTSAYADKVKDYIQCPKGNGYQSLHAILAFSVTSSVVPGACFEVQFRTASMHKKAIMGGASHKNYKKQKNKSNHRNLFHLIAEETDIVGFLGEDVDTDFDGLVVPIMVRTDTVIA